MPESSKLCVEVAAGGPFVPADQCDRAWAGGHGPRVYECGAAALPRRLGRCRPIPDSKARSPSSRAPRPGSDVRCSALVARRASVVLAETSARSSRSEDRLPARRRPAGTSFGAELDVTDADAVKEIVDRTVTDHGHLDLMFNNAGHRYRGRSPSSPSPFRAGDRREPLGVVHGVLAAYPIMIGQGRGHIVNTASLAGLVPAPGLTPYSMTKHAVVGLTTSLRPEAASHGVRVSVVCPGVIDTPLLDKPNPADLPTDNGFRRTREMLEKGSARPTRPSSSPGTSSGGPEPGDHRRPPPRQALDSDRSAPTPLVGLIDPVSRGSRAPTGRANRLAPRSHRPGAYWPVT